MSFALMRQGRSRNSGLGDAYRSVSAVATRRAWPSPYLPQVRGGWCACGGACPECQEKSGDLRTSHPNDPAEIEANQTASSVGRTTGLGTVRPNIKPASDSIHATGGESGGGSAIRSEISGHINSRRGGGATLSDGTRGFFEQRLGADFGQVRIHSGSYAEELSHALSAKAFTVGQDIFFGAGQFQPDTDSGKSLIAHELTHVLQGGELVRRCKDPADEARYDAIIAEIKLLDSFKNLDLAARARFEAIISEAKLKADCIYFARKLKVLFETPEKNAAQVATAIRSETAAAVSAEEKRLETPEAKKSLDVEEAATADPEPDPGPADAPDKRPAAAKKPGRSWTSYPTRFGGGNYKVDASDPADIFVKVKVNLVPGGDGTWDDVKNIKRLEDQIEKHASRVGFTLNLEFVNTDNRPDFVGDAETVTIHANPRWPNATNWGGDARACAHELFHVLNFPLDRYSYIESHSTNQKMPVSERLVWFLEQMHKPDNFDNPKSLMASGQYPIEEDVCMIARLDMATCLKVREKLGPIPLGFRIRVSGGVAGFGGSNAGLAAIGLDLGIPLRHQRDWMLFIGANASVIGQLDGDFRTAYLAGARLGLEKQWSPQSGGPILGAFAGAGAAFVSDRSVPGGTRSFLTAGYGELGLTAGYKFSPSFANLSIQAEFGYGATTKLELHDPTTGLADPKTLQIFQAGLMASLMF